MFQLFILIVIFAFNSGFLLDGQNPQISGTAQIKGHYLTIDDKFEIIHDLEKIRDEQKNTINMLTSQMRQRLEGIERQIKSDTGNTSCQNKVALFENQVRVLEKNNTDLSRKLDSLQLSFINFVLSSQNETKQLTQQLKALKELQSIQQLSTLNNVQEKVRTLDSSVHSLLNNELARNQDFLALYNITTHSMNLMDELKKGTGNKFLALESLEVQHGSSIDIIYNKTIQSESRINSLENTITANISSLKAHQDERVAFTACGGGGSIPVGTAIQFNSIRSSYGISNLASLKSTGIFTCEIQGLYLISAVIMSSTSDIYINIYKNNKPVIEAYINYSDISSSPAVLVTDLQVGDTIKIIPSNRIMSVYSQPSCVTIVKVA